MMFNFAFRSAKTSTEAVKDVAVLAPPRSSTGLDVASPATVKSPTVEASVTRLERWINKVAQNTSVHHEPTLVSYEPEFLYICCDNPPPTGGDTLVWDEQSIDYILRQFPLLTHVTFYGKRDPLLSLPRLLHLCQYLKQQRPTVHITLYTTGESLPQFSMALLQAPLNVVMLELGGHTPSGFQQQTGQAAQSFLQRYGDVYDVLTNRVQLGLTQAVFMGSLVVNQHNFTHMPDMLRWSEQLGLDAVVFHNAQLPWLQVGRASEPVSLEGAVHEQLEGFHTLVERMKPELFRIPFRLPSVFTSSAGSQRQQCGFAYHAITLTQDMSTHACPRLKLDAVETPKLWEGDVWNSRSFQYVRAVHGHYHQLRTQQPLSEVLPLLPKACQGCEFNRSTPPVWQNSHLLKHSLNFWL